jgi:hypothetical protein
MTHEQQQALDMQNQGMTRKEIAEELGISENSVKGRLERARKWSSSPKALTDGARAVGADTPASVVWTKTHKDGSVTHSVMHTKEKSDGDFVAEFTDSLADYKPLDQKLFAPRVNHGAKGDKLLVVDLADVHFDKLCVTSETNHEYNVEVARHRTIEGTRSLLNRADDVGRIVFVMGNDILHTDNGKSSTAGTPQDTAGTYFTAWRAAQHASIDAIGLCASVADVDLVHCMSNHDWRSGWALSQTIAAAMKGHTNVRATDYNLSERHRKYYGYGRNGMLFTHGDGAKEEKLTSLFLREARHMLTNTDLLYAYLHHFHHKIRNRRGVDVFQSEKDHIAFTQINTGACNPEGSGLQAEYVRSPSAPDGWHDRNGYVNRQAVEAFIHCPHDGQKDRLTEWF